MVAGSGRTRMEGGGRGSGGSRREKDFQGHLLFLGLGPEWRGRDQLLGNNLSCLTQSHW
jgi:hypothetical protein